MIEFNWGCCLFYLLLCFLLELRVHGHRKLLLLDFRPNSFVHEPFAEPLLLFFLCELPGCDLELVEFLFLLELFLLVFLIVSLHLLRLMLLLVDYWVVEFLELVTERFHVALLLVLLRLNEGWLFLCAEQRFVRILVSQLLLKLSASSDRLDNARQLAPAHVSARSSGEVRQADGFHELPERSERLNFYVLLKVLVVQSV